MDKATYTNRFVDEKITMLYHPSLRIAVSCISAIRHLNLGNAKEKNT